MNAERGRNIGSIMLIAIFVIALLSAMVIGILQMNTEEIQLMQNQIYAAQALATAEAGLNDAFSELRDDDEWVGPLTNEPFNEGLYNVSVTGTLPNLTIESEGTSAQGFVARVKADVTVDTSDSSDHTIRIDNLRINE
jgi:type II secretory pathway pseudopilin PulG